MSDKRQNILVVSLQGAGNNILSLPMTAALHEAYPDAEVDLLIQGSTIAEVLETRSFVNQVISAKGSKTALLRRLRARNYATALFAFPAGRRSHLLAWVAGIPRRIGHLIPERGTFALTDKQPMVADAHDLEQNDLLLARLGIPPAAESFWPPLDDIPQGYRSIAERYLIDHDLDPNKRYLGIHTGSDGRFAEKRYPPELFAKVAEMVFEEFGMPCIVFDGPAEQGTGKQLARAADTPVHALDGWGTYAEVWGMLSFCDLFVSNDSGLMNLASATGIPTVAVFGPSQPHRTRPYCGTIAAADLPCSHCYTLGKYSGCRYDLPRCLHDLPPEQVFEAVKEVLTR